MFIICFSSDFAIEIHVQFNAKKSTKIKVNYTIKGLAFNVNVLIAREFDLFIS